MAASVDDAFSREVTRLRAEYQRKRQSSNLFPPAGQPVLDMELVHETTTSMGLWYDDGSELGRYVRLFDLPGTLSGDILRLERTTRSDIYDVGNCIKCMVYANAPITNQVEWPVPQTLQAIVDVVCVRPQPNGLRFSN